MHITSLLISLSVLLAAAGVVTSLRLRLRAPEVLGTVLGRSGGARWPRPVAGLLVVAAATVLALSDAGGPGPWLALGLAALFVGLRPAFGDRVCGSQGVRCGWWLVRFEDLEEWRLIGEHLRFKLFEEWTAVPLAPEHHAAVRERLVAVAAERESGFGHGKHRPDDARPE